MRRLDLPAINSILARPVVGVLSTLNPDGYPYPTPIWFMLDPHVGLVMTSLRTRPHIRHLARDPRASLVVDLEGEPGPEGRPNVQVKVIGRAELQTDHERWTREITLRYGGSPTLAERRSSAARTAVILPTDDLLGVAAGPGSHKDWWVDTDVV